METYRQPFKGEYPVSQKYGELIPGVTFGNRPHTGIDFLMPEGTAVLASAGGIVKYARFDSTGFGYCVMIQHNKNTSTVYAHLSEIIVFENQKIKQGDVIGLSGNTGNSTGPHLHFEARHIWCDWRSDFDPHDLPLMSFDDSIVKKEIKAGECKIVCDLANVRCHCDPSRIIKQLTKDTIIEIQDKKISYNDLPYRFFWDRDTGCTLLIAEYDSFGTQIIEPLN